MRNKMAYQEYQMPIGPIYDQAAKLHAELLRDERYRFARSCKHCTDTGDSFNRYVSTYCHLRHEHIAGFDDKLDRCKTCEYYEKAIMWPIEKERRR